jgi:hypothetical protein
MIDWISDRRWRMPAILIAYFSVHVFVRCAISPSLDYDESEQVFLSQCLCYGYNSQPPLYTWVQTGIFELFGYSVFSLAAFKNLLLCGTYLLVFATVRKATGHLGLAVIAAIGLLTIPQIAWESHRDLSHTVAVTFATALAFYSVVSLASDGRSRWYVLIGVAAAVGMLSKYNFAIVIAAMITAGLTTPSYRRFLLDRRMAIAAAIAAVLILPHAVWMSGHLELISSKTLTTMTTDQSNHWLQDVSSGFRALSVSTLSCCAITVAMFAPFVWRRKYATLTIDPTEDTNGQATMLLIERFLIGTAVVLCVLILSGNALEFKNRWLQPFVVMLPAYLVLRLRSIARADRCGMNRICAMAVVLMISVLTATISRPLTSRYRDKYCWLNTPYKELASSLCGPAGKAPEIIVASDMRIAGNLRLQFPKSSVIAVDQQYLTDKILDPATLSHPFTNVVLVTDKTDRPSHQRLKSFAGRVLRRPSGFDDRWQSTDVAYLYGTADASHQFFVNELTSERIATRRELTVVSQ